MSITIQFADLKHLVGIVGKFTDPAPFMPDFNRVLFRSGGGFLTATATDRYSAAMARIESVIEPSEWSLTARECQAVLATFRGATSLTVTADGDEVSIGRAEGLLKIGSDVTMRFSSPPVAWTKSVDPLFFRTAASEQASSLATVNGEYLKRLPSGGCVAVQSGQVQGFYSDDWAVIVMGTSDAYSPAARLKSWTESKAVAA